MASSSSHKRISGLQEELEVFECGCGGGAVAEVFVSKNARNGGHLYYKCKSCDFYVWWVADKFELREKARKAREEAEKKMMGRRVRSLHHNTNPGEVTSQRHDYVDLVTQQVQALREDIRELKQIQAQERRTHEEELKRMNENQETIMKSYEDDIKMLKQWKESINFWGVVFLVVISMYVVMFVKS